MVFIWIDATLPLFVRGVKHESLCVTYYATSSGKWWDRAKVTVIFTFAFSFFAAEGVADASATYVSAKRFVNELTGIYFGDVFKLCVTVAKHYFGGDYLR